MKKLIFFLLIITGSAFGPCNIARSQVSNDVTTNTFSSSDKQIPDSTVFKALIEKYAQSIEQADTVLASKLWAQTDEVSFISPRGHEHRWNGVKNIYNLFATFFADKKLNFFNEKVAVYGDVAWLEFYWVFDATLKMDNSKIQTKGRETQIWKKINNEWRLVHVHYSGMPVTVIGQGF